MMVTNRVCVHRILAVFLLWIGLSHFAKGKNKVII